MENPEKTNWSKLTESPLAVFVGVFSVMESVVLVYLSGVKGIIDGGDASVIFILTIALFSLIVIARPQGFYPPEKWQELKSGAEVKVAIYAIISVMVILSVSWGVAINTHNIICVFGQEPAAACSVAAEPNKAM